MLYRTKTSPFEQSPRQNRKPDLNLIQPGGMFRRLHEPNAMAGMRQKLAARVHRLHDPTDALFP